VALIDDGIFHVFDPFNVLHRLLLAEDLDALSDLLDVLGAWLDGPAAVLEGLLFWFCLVVFQESCHFSLAKGRLLRAPLELDGGAHAGRRLGSES
jgi:hypothetical protein